MTAPGDFQRDGRRRSTTPGRWLITTPAALLLAAACAGSPATPASPSGSPSASGGALASVSLPGASLPSASLPSATQAPSSLPSSATQPPDESALPTASLATAAGGSGATNVPKLPPIFSKHSDPGLEAQLPKQVAGTALTIFSLSFDEMLASGTQSGDRAKIDAFLQGIGKSTADASFAGALDPSSKLTGGILAYKVNGADSARLLAGIVAVQQSDAGAGASAKQASVGGKNVTVISSESGSTDTQWVYGHGDVVFSVSAKDEATAAQYLQALP